MTSHRLCAAAVAAAVSFALPSFANEPINARALVAAAADAAAIYDLDTGQELARIALSSSVTDLAVTRAGIGLINDTGAHHVVVVDLTTAREITRLPASRLGGRRPVHLYLSPVIAGQQIAVVLNDGAGHGSHGAEPPTDSTATLIDVTVGSPSYLTAVGEVRLGHGHHKAAFSPTLPRMVISNISDCTNVLTVVDFANPAEPQVIHQFAPAAFGLDGSTPMRRCDASGRNGVSLAPHGVASSAASGLVFHHLTGTGQIAAIDLSQTPPALSVVQTAGTGGASIKDLPGGAVIVVPQRTPRELGLRGGGQRCQVGQLAVLDAVRPALLAQQPILSGGPDCSDSLAGRADAYAAPGYAIAPDGRHLFVQLGTLGGVREARSREIAVFDLGQPARPRQLPSIQIGAGDGTRDHAVTGDGRFLLVPNSLDATVSVVAIATRTVVKTLPTLPRPSRVGTFGAAGPSKPVGPPSLN
ncbi:MAG: hypothetical protein EAZ99_12005 [Alphaproteobacteria bacterium]|nr:MAG: hypothetical protein EAZ99_12005 [Alphaproteobacteria bacterium]